MHFAWALVVACWWALESPANALQQPQPQQQQPFQATSRRPAPQSPLVSGWSNARGQQPNQQNQQNQSPQSQQQAQQMQQQQQAPQEATSRAPGDVNLALATDFPNPNINNAGHEITKILRKFFTHGYDKRVRPNYSGPPALVNVSFHIIGISSVSEVQMDFTTDFYFRQKWFDPRLEFVPVVGITELCVGAEFADKIWLPDTFFANEKTATFHKATTENTFIRVAANGRVYRSIRLTVTCSCPMDLQYFPMDRQRCKIEIESYGYNTRDIDYRWEKGNESVSLDTKIELPQFKILGFKMGHELQSLSSGDYLRLYCEIHFVRSMGYYLIQIYIPASLIVIISWVSFWLHRNATPARVALGVTTVLTMTTLMSSTNAALPKISYIKSIDVFLGTCFVMVFASLLEYAAVGYIGKRIAMERKRLADARALQAQHSKICVAAAAASNASKQAEQQHQQQLSRRRPTTALATPTAAAASNTMAASSQRLPEHCDSLAVLQHRPLSPAPPSKRLEQQLAPQAPLAEQQQHARLLRQVQLRLGSTSGAYSLSKDSLAAHRLLAAAVGGGSSGKFEAPPAPTASSSNGNGAGTGTGGDHKEDVVSACGITPSAIDKYSRVGFPICFVCFNLMYWIVYVHISQQTDDKGPPLIPFIRS